MTLTISTDPIPGQVDADGAAHGGGTRATLDTDRDIVRVQDVGLHAGEDPAILAWAAQEGRILLTHDVRTMTRHAYERVRRGQMMPGILQVPVILPIGRAVEEILIVAECSDAAVWEGQIGFLPL